MKKKLVAMMLMMALVLIPTGCGNEDNTASSQTQESTQEQSQSSQENQDQNQSTVENGSQENDGAGAENAAGGAVEVLTQAAGSLTDEMPCFGGSIEASVDGAPGALSLTDTNTMTNTLLIPEDLQSKITDAATLMHMMNANTFTGVSMKVDGESVEAVADKMKEAFLNNQFMCGIPDKIVILGVNDYVVYAYGAADIVDEFKANAEGISGAKVLADQNY